MPPQSSPTTSDVPQAAHTTSSSGGGSMSPIGSPPLILAFLAIGIFSAAMIAVFGWRRVQFGRELGYEGAGRDGRRFAGAGNSDLTDSAGRGGSDSRLGEKPVLWEAWADRGARVDGVDYGFWDNVMPLAVLQLYEPSNALITDQNPLIPLPTASSNTDPLTSRSPPTDTQPQSQHLIPPSSIRQRFDDFTPLSLFRRHNRANATPDDPLTTNQTTHGEDKEAEEQKIAQVAVIIEMPSLASSRQRHHYERYHSHAPAHQRSHSLYSSFSKSETLVESHDRMREDILGIEDGGQFQFCIGVHACPWPISTTSTAAESTVPTRIPQSPGGKVLT